MKALFLLATLVLALTGCDSSTEASACRTNLECRAEGFIAKADVDCMSPVLKSFGPHMRWDETREKELVSSFKWKDKAKGTIAYYGDKVLLDTPKGTVRVQYECDFDPDSLTNPVLAVQILPHHS